MLSRARTLLLLALLPLGCRDFAVSADAPVDEVENLEVRPLRLRAGATLAIEFDLRWGGEVQVTVNGLPARAEGREGGHHRWSYTAQGDEGEILNVAVSATRGQSKALATAQAYLDVVAPPRPDEARLALDARPPGLSDRLAGLPGCVGGSDARSVELALDPAGRIVLAGAPLAADGSFPSLDLGDNTLARLYVFSVDEAGNRSAPVAVDNDVEGPRPSPAELVPGLPRAGRPLRATLRFDEPLAAPPRVELRAGEARLALEVGPGDDGSWRAHLAEVTLPVGPALLAVEASDPLGNSRRVEQPLRVADPVDLGVERVALLRRPPAGWVLISEAGAAPFPGQVEAWRVHAGAERLCGMRLVASDGSFDAIEIAPELVAGDRVLLRAYDEDGGAVAEALLEPDLAPPSLLSASATPSIVGPTAEAAIAVEADEPLGPATAVLVDGRPATRVDGAAPERALFRYAVTGEETRGEVEVVVRLVDRAGNAAADHLLPLTIDLDPPQLALLSAGSPWAPPAEPPPLPSQPPLVGYAPPDQLEVRADDALSGVAAARWSLVNLRSGESWDGQGWVGVSPPLELVASSVPFTVSLLSALPADERVELTVVAEDEVGNAGTTRVRVSRYSEPKLRDVGPTSGGATVPGYGLALSRVGERGLCVVSLACPTSAPGCLSPVYNGRVALSFSGDGGQTWTSSDPGLPFADQSRWPRRVAFDESGTHGLAVGYGMLLRLDARCAPDPVPAVAPTAGDIGGVAWDGSTAWIAADDGVYRSLDAGVTWTKVDVGESGAFYGITVTRSGRVLAVGQGSVIVSSPDRGQSWSTQLVNGSTGDLLDVAEMPDGALYVAGMGVIARASGENWIVVDAGYPAGTVWKAPAVRATPRGPLFRFMEQGSSGQWSRSWWRLPPGEDWYYVWEQTPLAIADFVDFAPLDAWGMYATGAMQDSMTGRFHLRVLYTVSGWGRWEY